jgi:hypothetical protein
VHEVTVGHFREFVRATKYRTAAETDQGGIIWNNDLKKWQRKAENVWNNVELSGEDTHPVVFVTLADAQALCAWLTKQEGRAYAVPAEEQWEWACRAGATTRWFFGNDAIAMKDFGWTTPRSEGKLKPVGHLAPNPFGLYDIYGNANELTMNLQQQAVGRGGEAGESPHRARSASRFVIEKQYDPSYRRGFRVVIVGDLQAKANLPRPHGSVEVHRQSALREPASGSALRLAATPCGGRRHAASCPTIAPYVSTGLCGPGRPHSSGVGQAETPHRQGRAGSRRFQGVSGNDHRIGLKLGQGVFLSISCATCQEGPADHCLSTVAAAPKPVVSQH